MRSPLFGPGRPDVNFDDVGQIAKRYAWIVGNEVIEGEQIARLFQPLAGRHHAVFGFDGLQNLDHGLIGWQQGHQVFEQDFPGAIYEGVAPVAERVQSEQQRAVEGAARGQFLVCVEIVFHAVAEKKFVSKHLLCLVKNGLAGNKPLSGKRQRLRCRGRLGGRNGFHLLSIGPPA